MTNYRFDQMGPRTPHADRDASDVPARERWSEWHSAMQIAGLGLTPPDALTAYVRKAMALADAEIEAAVETATAELRNQMGEYQARQARLSGRLHDANNAVRDLRGAALSLGARVEAEVQWLYANHDGGLETNDYPLIARRLTTALAEPADSKGGES